MGCSSIVEIQKKERQIVIRKPDEPDALKTFRFDEVFGPESKQQEVYDEAAF